MIIFLGGLDPLYGHLGHLQVWEPLGRVTVNFYKIVQNGPHLRPIVLGSFSFWMWMTPLIGYSYTSQVFHKVKF